MMQRSVWYLNAKLSFGFFITIDSSLSQTVTDECSFVYTCTLYTSILTILIAKMKQTAAIYRFVTHTVRILFRTPLTVNKELTIASAIVKPRDATPM